MAVTDIHNTAQTFVVSDDSSSALEKWGKNVLSELNLANTTQLTAVKYGYILLVDGTPVVVTLNDNLSTNILQKPINAQPIAIANRLDLIKDRLALTITQLAELFGVTRKTVYDWYDGTEPRRLAITRMEILINVLDTVSSEVEMSRLKTVWNIPVSGKSFCRVFSDDNINNETLQKVLLEKLNELSSRMVTTASHMQKTNNQFGEYQLAEFDRRTDLS